MLLTNTLATIQHLETITHDGKVVLFGVDERGGIHYSVKRSGFEDSALAEGASQFGFEEWRSLPLDKSLDDSSVEAHEATTLVAGDGSPLLRSRYGTSAAVTTSTSAPVRAVSGLGHIYVFRCNPDGYILVSRFVLDGMQNVLVPKLEVRFRRSRRRLEPDSSMAKSSGGLMNVDSLDYRDMDDVPFYEPAIELSFLGACGHGWFDVVLAPTSESGSFRWHLFTYDAIGQKLVIHSVRSSEIGLFDVEDYLYAEPQEREQMPGFRTIPGIIRREVELPGLAVAGAPAATEFDLQAERKTKTGMQLLRTGKKVMVAVPVLRAGETEAVTAVLCFTLGLDGMLSQIDLSPDQVTTLRAQIRDVLLPLDTLDEIKVVARAEPLPSGAIATIVRGEGDRLHVVSHESLPPGVAPGAMVRLRGTQSYNGPHAVVAVEGDSFVIEAAFVNGEPGFWEVVPSSEAGLVFDNMIVGYEKAEDGRLRILTQGHDLGAGDMVQVTGTAATDGVYAVVAVADEGGFTLDIPYRVGEAINLSAIKRRGIRFDGDDYLESPPLELAPGSRTSSFGRTVSAWIKLDMFGAAQRQVIRDNGRMLTLGVDDQGRAELVVRMHDGSTRSMVDPTPLPVEQWVHLAGVLDYDAEAGGVTRLSLLRDGQVVHEDLSARAISNQYMLFDGVDDGVSLPAVTADFSAGFTIEAWVRWDSLSVGWRRILELSNGPADERIILCKRKDRPALAVFVTQGGQNVQVRSPDFLEPYTWMHVAAVVDAAGVVTFYKDGQASVRNPVPLPVTTTRIFNAIGCAPYGDGEFTGGMAEVRLWNRPRTAAELSDTRNIKLIGDEPGLVGYWPLSDVTALDQGPNGLHGTLVDTPTIDSADPPAASPAPASPDAASLIIPFTTPAHLGDQLIQFDGADDGFTTSPCATPTTAITVSAWARSDTATWTAADCVLAKAGAFALTPVPGSRAIGFVAHIGGAEVGPASGLTHTPADIQGWHHYAGTYDGRAARLYVDGALVAEVAATGPLATPMAPITIGWDGQSGHLAGQVAEAKLYAYALTADQLRADMFQAAEPTAPGLAGYWPLADGRLADLSAFKNHGTLSGAPEVQEASFSFPAPEQKQALQFTERECVLLDGVQFDMSGGFCVEAWVCVDEVSPWARVFSTGGGRESDNVTMGFVNNSNDLTVRIYEGATEHELVVPNVLVLHEWMHLAVTVAADGHTTVYKNGSPLGSKQLVLPRAVQRRYARLAMDSWNGRAPLHGRLAEVRWWRGPRTEAQIKAGLFTVLSGRELGLQGYWPLHDGRADDLSPFGRHGTFKGSPAPVAFPHWSRGTGEHRIGEGFVGHLSEARVWDRACTPVEVRTNMHVQLTGRELGLAGYWRLGAIVHDDPAFAPDFTPRAVHARVYGNPYAGARSLARATGSGKPAVMYVNHDLVAVSARAQYEEEFEFRVRHPSREVDVNNADGTGRRLFRIGYRGKASRGSEQWTVFPPSLIDEQDFEPVDDGWQRARARFTVPDGVALLRTFELVEVAGVWAGEDTAPADEWTEIEVRKHRIRMIADSVTRHDHRDLAALATLSDSGAAAEALLAPAADAEAKVIETRHAIAELVEELDVAVNRDMYVAERDSLTALVTSLEAKKAKREKDNAALQKPIDNYYFCIVNEARNEALKARLTDGRVTGVPYDDEESILDSMLWQRERFEEVSPLHSLEALRIIYKIAGDLSGYGYKNKESGTYLTASPNTTRPSELSITSDKNLFTTWWRGSDGHHLSNYAHMNMADEDKRFWCTLVSDGGAEFWFYFEDDTSADQRWRLEKGQLLPHVQEEVDKNSAEIDSLTTEIDVRRQRLERLDTLLENARPPGEVRDAIKDLQGPLDLQEGAFAAASDAYLAALVTGDALDMPVIAQDLRGLVTSGAVLDFVKPAGAVHAMATCEGNVALSYRGRDGGVRQAVYDAVADSRNSTFEQWLPVRSRVALACAGASDRLDLARPIPLDSGAWTFETWLQLPLSVGSAPNPSEYGYPRPWVALTGASSSDDSLVVIRDGYRLGTLVSGFFFDSGVDLRRLTPGWHHLAAVGADRKTSYYLDGQRVRGSYERDKPEPRLALDFLLGSDRVVRDGLDSFPERAMTVAFWLATTSTEAAATPLCYHTGPSDLTVAVTNPGSLTVHINGAELDTQVACNDGFWHHVAFTWEADPGLARVYVDGQPVAQGSLSKDTPVTAGGTLVVGGSRADGGSDKRDFSGRIGGLSIRAEALNGATIRDRQYKVFDRDDDAEKALVLYWPMRLDRGDDKTTVEDRGPNRLPGELLGAPRALSITQVCTSDVAHIGNDRHADKPAGGLAHVRLWNEALSADEIATISKLAATGNEPELLGCWPLDEGSGVEARDRSPHAAHAQVSGGRWIALSADIGDPVRGDDVGDAGARTNPAANKAMRFNGVDQHVRIAHDPAYNPSAVTVCLWAMMPDAPAREAVVMASCDDDAGAGFELRVSHDRCWQFLVRIGQTSLALKGSQIAPGKWTHLAASIEGTQVRFYVDGALADSQRLSAAYVPNPAAPLTIGAASSRGQVSLAFAGQVAQLSIWQVALSDVHLAHIGGFYLDPSVSDLVAYWPLNDVIGGQAVDIAHGHHSDVCTGRIVDAQLDLIGEARARPAGATVPAHALGVVCAEYSATDMDGAGRVRAMMRRFYGLVADDRTKLFTEQRVEQLVLRWVGNQQLSPTLLGYIEGAPPVPSENLTVNPDYDGATSVSLIQSDNVNYTWSRSEETNTEFNRSVSIGYEFEKELVVGLGTAVSEKLSEIKGGAGLEAGFGTSRSSNSAVTAGASLTMTDSIRLTGLQEPEARFPHLGRRYTPKNVGYALVISGMADVFVTSLARTGRMVGYEVRPVQGVPLDVNTITFLINPAYIKNGSLDGLVGSAAADPLFYHHVPEMRSQYGALYPASYYRLNEAYALKERLERRDKARETYFANYDVTGLSAIVSGGDIDSESDEAASIDAGSSNPDNAGDDKRRLKADAAKREQAIGARSSAVTARVRAASAFDAWQRRMERLLIHAGKRNIVNTYVWDADGGMRSEEQGFAETVEHTIGGGFSASGGGNLNASLMFAGFALETSLMVNASTHKTLSKTQTTDKSFQLQVDMSGMEGNDITDLQDYPLYPGEKVDRYRFMTFYLEGHTDHFHDFFSRVVDPEWLMSNDEEARALRQTMAGRPNRCWRVMHRVTYVERPVLMGFGRDMRTLADEDQATREIINYFDGIDARHDELVKRLEAIEAALNKQ
ncbi:LamG domain-containing protein [Haliangium sp.]|uniref:LamG domain-containing protein n=1 Tax=Haliangium sp. TaxID=2663208 RepID=UPI003D111B4E